MYATSKVEAAWIGPFGRRMLPIGLALAFLAATADPAAAGIDFYRLFKSEFYNQTSNAAPTTPAFYNGEFDIINHNPADPTSGTVKDNTSGIVTTLSPNGPGFANFGQAFATLAALDASYPSDGRSYLYTSTSGSTNGQTGTLTSPTSDLFAAQVPAFTGTTFSQLQGINAASGFTFNFTPFTPQTGISVPLIFFTLTDTTTNQVVFSTSGPNTLTSETIAPNTLVAGHSYDVSVDFSSRIDTPNAGFNGTATAEYAFDQRVDLLFTTAAVAVPEPSSLVLSGLGLIASLGLAWRRRLRA